MADVLHVATRKGLFRLEPDDGGGWAIARASFVGDPVTIVLDDARDGSLYAGLNLGHFGTKLRRSTDGGASWEEIAVPAFDPVPEDADEATKQAAPSVKQLWALEGGGADRPGVLWAGTIPGALFCSDDRGASWRLVRSLWDRPERASWFGGGYDEPGIHSICVDPRDSRHLAIAVSCGGAWFTEDDGESWEVRTKGMYAEYMPPERRDDPAVQDPHLMVRCAADPDTLWVQHHNGVFSSRDNGRSWRAFDEIPPAKFGFAVAVHPGDPGTAWFVPAVKDECRVPVEAAVVVTRTRDGGERFEVLREGLPQQHAYDLVFRHALDVDGSGRRLALGSTTGSLWVSENGGDSWSQLSAHLPPIYQVRWA